MPALPSNRPAVIFGTRDRRALLPWVVVQALRKGRAVRAAAAAGRICLRHRITTAVARGSADVETGIEVVVSVVAADELPQPRGGRGWGRPAGGVSDESAASRTRALPKSMGSGGEPHATCP